MSVNFVALSGRLLRRPPVSNLDPADAPLPWVRLLLHPAYSLPTAIAPVLVGAALAVRDGVFSPLPVALAFGASWLVHVGGLYGENYWLLTRHAQLREHAELAKAVECGALSLTALRNVTIACFLLAVVVGGGLVRYAGVMAPVLGAVGAIASLGYCAGRCSWTRLGIAEPVFFAMFGVVAVAGTYYVQAAPFHGVPDCVAFAAAALPWSAFVIGMPIGAIVTAVMLVDDLSDIDVDAAKGWRTTPVVRGAVWSRRKYAALLLFAYAMPVWFWVGLGFGAWIFLPWLSAPLAFWAVRRVHALAPAQVEPLCPKTAALGLLYALLLAVGIVLSR